MTDAERVAWREKLVKLGDDALARAARSPNRQGGADPLGDLDRIQRLLARLDATTHDEARVREIVREELDVARAALRESLKPFESFFAG